MVEGLREADGRALLNSVVRWPLDERVADRLVAETRGTRWRCSSCHGGCHLRKVFAKLGISSRRELHEALPDHGGLAQPA